MNELRDFLKKTVVKAGNTTLKLFNKVGVKYTKGNAMDVVTEADLLSHRMISALIQKKYPEHGIISEEDKDYNTHKEYVWVIDPLDGTLNFSRGTPLFGVFLALVRDNDIIMAAAYMPCTKELYFAEKNQGAFLNDRKIHCSSVRELSKSYGVFGSVWNKKRQILNRNIIMAIGNDILWINSMGCAAVATGLVARGQRDWSIGKGGGVWDYTAQALILQEAGCKISRLNGDKWLFGDTEIVAANPLLHKQVLRLTKGM